MNIMGPTLGKVSAVPGNFLEWNVNQAIAIFWPRQQEHTAYFAYYIWSRFAQRWYFQSAKQTSGQVNISLEMCNALLIPWPKKDREHEVIFERLNFMDRRIGAEKASKNKLDSQKNDLMRDLLTEHVCVKVA